MISLIISLALFQRQFQPSVRTTPTTVPKPILAVVYTIGWFDGNVYALQANVGSELWHAPIASAHGDEEAALVDGTLFFGSDNHNMYAVSTTTHSVLWSFKTDGILNSSPSIVNNVAYVGSWDGYMYALNAQNGSQKWRYQTGGQIHSSPVIVDGLAIFGSTDGNVYALHTNDGSLGWIYPTGGPVTASPVVVNGSVYIGSGDHNVYALSVSNGTKLWSFKTEKEIYLVQLGANPFRV